MTPKALPSVPSMMLRRCIRPSRSATPPPRGAVEANAVHFVEIGERAVLVGDVADRADRGDVAIHRVDAFEGDELGRVRRIGRHQPVEIGRVIVLEYAAGGAAVANALDHRGMVHRVRIDDAAGDARRERAERRPVRNIAGGEDQRGFLAVQVRELAFEQHVVVVGAGDVAGAARPCPALVDGFLHGAGHDWGSAPCRDSRWSTRR